MTNMVTIAVDAMGGDYAPREIVHGSVLAARELGVSIQLVGLPDAISRELARHDTSGLNITVIPATEVIAMDEKPGRAILKKKDSSILVAVKQVAEKKADGVVAAGSTGAAAVAAHLTLGRINNVDRSAIAARMPTIHGNAILLDAGANVDNDAQQLAQYAVIGSILYRGLYGVARPRVGIMNMGTEETKGTALVHEAYELIKQIPDLNFLGYVEGRDFPMDKCDVVVTDGFTGNCCLKTAEGIARMMSHMLKQELLADFRNKVGAILAKPAMEALKKRVDYNYYGGALLVGLKGVCVIAHGGSKHTAVKYAIKVAYDMVKADIVNQIERAFDKTTAGSKV